MNPEILSQLRDVHLPPTPSWWPPAPGYLIVIFLLVTSALTAWGYYRKRRPRLALKKQVLSEIKEIEQNFSRTGDTRALQSGLAQLVRRLISKVDPSVRAKSLELAELCPRLEKLWGASHTTEFVDLLEHDRFKRSNSLDGAHLIFLANKKFKQCKL